MINSGGKQEKAFRTSKRETGWEDGAKQLSGVDLTDQEWVILEPLIPSAKPGGLPHTTDMREVINAILCLNRTGGQWRALPHEFAAWFMVWSYFRQWRNDGTWQRMHTALRQQTRLKQGREPTPSAAIIDSQSNRRQSCQTYARV